MRRAVTHFTRTWIMWSKVSAQRHTHTESPPTFFILLNCKPSKPGLSFFFVTHVYKNLFCDILHVLRIVMLLLCVCENVCVRFSLLNVWSMKVEKSMRFHFVCYLIYTDTCPLIYMKFYIYTPLSIWVHLHVLLQRRACVLTFEVCVLPLTQLATYMTSFTHLTMKYQYVVEIFISGKHQHSTVNIYNIL